MKNSQFSFSFKLDLVLLQKQILIIFARKTCILIFQSFFCLYFTRNSSSFIKISAYQTLLKHFFHKFASSFFVEVKLFNTLFKICPLFFPVTTLSVNFLIIPFFQNIIYQSIIHTSIHTNMLISNKTRTEV